MHCAYRLFILIVEVAATTAVVDVTFSCDIIMIIVLGGARHIFFNTNESLIMMTIGVIIVRRQTFYSGQTLLHYH